MRKTIKQNNKVVGFVRYNYSNDYSKKRNIDIEWVEIFKKYKRQGFATKLLKELLAKLKKEKIVWVSLWTGYEIEKNNLTNIYKNLGFEEKYYQEDYYKKGIGARLFTIRLN